MILPEGFFSSHAQATVDSLPFSLHARSRRLNHSLEERRGHLFLDGQEVVEGK